MAITVAFTPDNAGRQVSGRQRVVSGRLTLTGTYVTGGFSITASDFGLSTIDTVIPGNAWLLTEVLTAVWDSTNSKIKLGWSGGAISSELDEITNGDTDTGFVLDVTVKGK